jgi:hypothetical protein
MRHLQTLRRSAFVAGLSSLALSVHAAVPAAVTDAIDDMQADALVVASAVLVAIIAVMAIKFIRKGM